MIDDSRFYEHFFEDTLPPDPRCPVVLILDLAAPVSVAVLHALDAGLQQFFGALARDAKAGLRIDLALLSGAPNPSDQAFAPAGHTAPRAIQKTPGTLLSAKITLALDLLSERKKDYEASDLSAFRPWIFVVTNRSTYSDDPAWRDAAARARALDSRKELALFSVGFGGADTKALHALSTRQPLTLRDQKNSEMFQWLASNLTRVAHATLGEEVALSSPLGWGTL